MFIVDSYRVDTACSDTAAGKACRHHRHMPISEGADNSLHEETFSPFSLSAARIPRICQEAECKRERVIVWKLL